MQPSNIAIMPDGALLDLSVVVVAYWLEWRPHDHGHDFVPKLEPSGVNYLV